jgi:L-2-hydroxyglutarate oxidase
VSHVVVVGAGIVGMAIAARLAGHGHQVTVLEKERDLAEHQSGRNSGIVHSGVYHALGSGTTRMGVEGQTSIARFAQEHHVPIEICGSLVVAGDESDLPRLNALAARAEAAGVPARLITPQEAREYEPHVACVAALRVETTGITDYAAICRALAREVRQHGGEILFDHAFRGARTIGRDVWVSTERTTLTAAALVVCGGLHADQLARACGLDPAVRIVPFRSEYHGLVPEAEGLVRGLVAPVPDPRFPFLGIHLSRMIHGGVHAGPNTVLALAREGYRRGDVSPGDLRESLTWPGVWRLGLGNLGPAAHEAARTFSRRRFAATLARLVPDLTRDDLVPSFTAVRAQAVTRDGRLVQDYVLQTAPRQVHVINAPSPAATTALEIARRIERELVSVTPGLPFGRREKESSADAHAAS